MARQPSNVLSLEPDNPLGTEIGKAETVAPPTGFPTPEQDPGFQDRFQGILGQLQQPEVLGAILQFSSTLLNKQGSTANVFGNAAINAVGAAGRAGDFSARRAADQQQLEMDARQQEFENEQTSRRTGALETTAGAAVTRANRPVGRGRGKVADLGKERAARLKAVTEMLSADNLLSGGESDAFTLERQANEIVNLESQGFQTEAARDIALSGSQNVSIASKAVEAGLIDADKLTEVLLMAETAEDAQAFMNLLESTLQGQGETSVTTEPVPGGKEPTSSEFEVTGSTDLENALSPALADASPTVQSFVERARADPENVTAIGQEIAAQIMESKLFLTAKDGTVLLQEAPELMKAIRAALDQ